MDLTRLLKAKKLRESGWRSRGYLPHYDGYALPQFITLHLGDSLPSKVIEKWRRELTTYKDLAQKIILQDRIQHYLDQGYGSCGLGDHRVATLVQDSLLKFDGDRYKLFAWVIMPNHTHYLLKRSDECELSELLGAHKSYTAHKANKILERSGKFWMEEHFDRFIRNGKHFRTAVKYIENNPVKAGLCAKPEDWPFSSAWFRVHEDRSK